MKTATCIEDLRLQARRKVPRAFYDYVDTGSYNEETYHANRADLMDIKLRQRILVDVSARDLTTTIVGQKAAAPIVLAPIGLCGMQHGDGEILSAQAANEAGVPFTLSTMSICSIEDVAQATHKPFWFQLYVIKDRAFSKDILERAQAAKCDTLVLTVDLQVLGQRHRDIKNGMTVPPQIRLKNVIDIASKQAQDLRQSGRPCEGHGERHPAGGVDRATVRSGAELEGRGVDQEDLAGQAGAQGHHGCRGRQDRGEARRRRAGGVEPRRPATRRRAVVDLGAAANRRRGGQ
jgi:isopentenyl diphosphate isomerase/L-lactate dehydrogenase-like FMN-dependent dehydrogenase